MCFSSLSPPQVIKGSTRLYVALLNSCLRLGKVAICRLIPRQTAGPTFVALLPQEAKPLPSGNELPKGFFVIPLPFADDMRDFGLEKAIPQPSDVCPCDCGEKSCALCCIADTS